MLDKPPGGASGKPSRQERKGPGTGTRGNKVEQKGRSHGRRRSSHVRRELQTQEHQGTSSGKCCGHSAGSGVSTVLGRGRRRARHASSRDGPEPPDATRTPRAAPNRHHYPRPPGLGPPNLHTLQPGAVPHSLHAHASRWNPPRPTHAAERDLPPRPLGCSTRGRAHPGPGQLLPETEQDTSARCSTPPPRAPGSLKQTETESHDPF